MTTPVTRRATKSAETRRAEILDAAVRLFDAPGYDGATVSDIARAAGVAAGTVYLYYPSKEHVLLALHAEFHTGMEATMAATFERVWARVEDESLSNPQALELMVDAMVDAVVHYVREHPARSAVICRYVPRVAPDANTRGQTAEYIAAAIEVGQEAGRVAVSDPAMAALLLEAAFSGPLSHMVVEGDDAAVDRFASQAKEFFVKALAPPA